MYPCLKQDTSYPGTHATSPISDDLLMMALVYGSQTLTHQQMNKSGPVLMGTLLGTVVTVLVAWTKFRYEIGSPSLGTKLVDTIEAILGKMFPRKGFLGKLS